MLPRSTLPAPRAQEEGLCALLPETRAGECSVLFIVAHPGDEIVAAGGALSEVSNPRFLHVTDGAPRDIALAIEDGYFDRSEYADARKREFAAALQCAGLKDAEVSELRFVAGDVSRNLATLTMSIATALREQQPDAVVTHAYEGTHPDQDAIAFAVQTACALLESDGRQTPLRLEAAGYADLGGDAVVGDFITPSFTDGMTVQLSKERRRLKQCMLERMPTRLKRLQNVPLNRESFRVAPEYDYAQPPQEGVLHYEKSGDALNGKRWRRLAADALRALGLAIG